MEGTKTDRTVVSVKLVALIPSFWEAAVFDIGQKRPFQINLKFKKSIPASVGWKPDRLHNPEY